MPSKPNIWNEEGCGRCGARCYLFGIPELNNPYGFECPHLIIDKKNYLATCLIHDDELHKCIKHRLLSCSDKIFYPNLKIISLQA